MFNHAPKNYRCPMCRLITGSDEGTSKQEDIIFKVADITLFISSKWWVNNPGHVMIIPNKHFENLYDIPDELLAKIYVFAKKVAIALKKIYKCDGTSTRQHNEPAGDQDLWHFHVHVFPRYLNDNLYKQHDDFRFSKPEERMTYATKLREYFSKH